jgi:ribosome maturation factor RimP
MSDRVAEETVSSLQAEIEARLATSEPDVEVLLAEVVGGATLRLFIDHPEGVTLDLCERVSGHLGDYRERYALEVSSPGSDRPLTKPQHFSRFLGRHARVRLREARDGHRSVTGELVGASEQEVTIAAGDGLLSIPYSDIARSNLVPGD